MTNEEILKERWKNIDLYLRKWLKGYNKINRKTKDNIQSIFDSVNIDDLINNKTLSRTEKDRLDRFILDAQEKGLFKGYFGYKSRQLLSKKKVSYKEMLEYMIEEAYIEENQKLKEVNNSLFLSVSKDSYTKGIRDAKKPYRPFEMSILYNILNLPLFNMTAEEYLYSLAQTNAQELYKQTLINAQVKKELNVDSKFYKELFQKQSNRYFTNNHSGGIENIVETISNQSYVQAGIDENVKKCRFIAEFDKKTTHMCNSLNNQIFKLKGLNTYSRYSDIDKKNVIYNTDGLKVGENLPPITNHFHWCRSTITYLIDNDITKNIRDNIKITNNYDREQFSRYKKYFINEITDDVEEFTKMKYNNPNEWEYLKQNYQYAKHRYNAIKENKLDKDISVHDYIRKVHEIRQELLNYKMYNGKEVKEIAYHFYDRVIGNPGEKRIPVLIIDIKDTLSNSIEIKIKENDSVRIIGNRCQVSFNPNDMRLIQAIPKRYEK